MMRTRHKASLAAFPLAISAVALVVAACSSSATGPTAGAYGAAAPGPSAAPAAAGITVGHTSLGSVLTDPQGRTLYLFEKDMGTASACTGACAAVWPPLLTTAAHATVVGGAVQALLGQSQRADGTTQLTYGGHPLYRFSGDHNPGDTAGEGLHAFGGTWEVLSTAGHEVQPPAASPAPMTAKRHAAPPTTCTVPQNNGGDHDADNNGGPSDGDGCDQ
jgi:predicted lipoprotein with Yx(FWY)xxD motif